MILTFLSLTKKKKKSLVIALRLVLKLETFVLQLDLY
jgi:hypothetical protein